MIRQGKNSDLGTVNPFTASEKTTELNKTTKAANEGRKVPYSFNIFECWRLIDPAFSKKEAKKIHFTSAKFPYCIFSMFRKTSLQTDAKQSKIG